MKLSRENLLSYDPSEFCHSMDKKPIEIYMFVDPLCPECWAMEPIIKKLQIEYGKYFSIRHVLSGKLATLNMSRKKRYETIAELQGRKKGIRFLRKLQEVLFLEKQNVSNFEVLKNCARSVGLDVEEFVTDIHSETAAKAFQCDLKITNEMDVQEIPTFVFFNANVEEEGIKITGLYPYEVYVQILEEMLQEKPEASKPPVLEQFLKQYTMVASKEVSVVYDMTVQQAEKELKKLMLKQKVEQIPAKYGVFWRYVEG